MKIRFVGIFLFFFLSASSFAHTFLCSLVKRLIVEEKNAATPQELQQLIAEAIKDKYSKSVHGGYALVLKVKNKKEQSAIMIPGGGDTQVVVELPPPHEKTIFELLTPLQRFELLTILQNLFRQGEYDFDFFHLKKGELSPLGKLIKEKQEELYSQGQFLIVGTDPNFLLARAVLGCKVGVCRNVNYSLFGLAIELGWPKDLIRFVSGRVNNVDKLGHGWLEAAMDYELPFLEFDGTPLIRELHQKVIELSNRGHLPLILGSNSRERFPFGQRNFWFYGNLE